jgi:hypothetical protein
MLAKRPLGNNFEIPPSKRLPYTRVSAADLPSREDSVPELEQKNLATMLAEQVQVR